MNHVKIRQPRFASRLRALRSESGLSQAAFARAAALSRQLLHQYEAGEREPGLAVLMRLVQALRTVLDRPVSLDELAGV